MTTPTALTATAAAKPGESAPTLGTASETNAADKKPSAATESNATSSSGATMPASTLQIPPPTLGSASEATPASPASTAPTPAPTLPQDASAASSDPAPTLPQPHQMLDSAPPAGATPPATVPPDSATAQSNVNISAQMHVGMRTDAFGSVEIHTVVEQSQVGITVHSDRDIARWFNSEVPSLESGLNNSHLNLTGVHFDSGRSGVQTAAGFQQGQPRQHHPETPASPAAPSADGLPEPETAEQSATASILPAVPFLGAAATRVSIHA